MMKTFLLSLVVMTASAGAFAASPFPNASEMEANFHACEQNSPYWHQRFGQYVVAFDLDSANAACAGRDEHPELAACDMNGGWIYAGYYCQINSQLN